MPRNESSLDRTLRIVAGLVLIGLWPFGVVNGAFAVALVVVGAVLLITGAVGFCPLYRLLGISTCPVRRSG